MASSVTVTDGGNPVSINVEQIAYVIWEKAQTTIMFAYGHAIAFKEITEREKDALKRALRINPA
ncbi:MAG TPA: hypothetical protein VG942_12830 [Hyphomonadaceae bacterium]|nr:hypothetical protein [Hyphomonadaceae bacterium]